MSGPLNQEYNIGFNPEFTAANWGNRQTSAWGNAVRTGYEPYAGVNFDWFAFDPDYPWTNYMSRQISFGLDPEYLWAENWGYRGILPIALQPTPQEDYPFDEPYPFNQSP